MLTPEVFKLLDYGFAIFVGAILLTLAVWTIRTLLKSLQSQASMIDEIRTNHLLHIHEELVKVGDRLSAVQSTSTEGFDRMCASVDKGMEKQAQILDKVLAVKCPLLGKDN
jgi:hypothetical protein